MKTVRLGLVLLLVFFLGSLLQVMVLRFVNPVATPLMILSRIDGYDLRYSFTSIEKISAYLQQAVQAAEDQRFMEHRGFDWDEIRKAAQDNQRRKKMRGASTISMQVARNLFLWQSKSYVRKGFEAYYTFLIESCWSKKRILEVYLNIAEWGPGIFGAQAAARTYFSQDASKLNSDQAALLAAVLPSPRKWSVVNPGPYVRKRSAEIRSEMQFFQALGQRDPAKKK